MMKKISAAELLELNSQGVLWHGVNGHNVLDILKQGYFEPRTSHRFWADGIRRKDNDAAYEDSKWMYGWSMSRDLTVSRGFGDILFVFEKAEIQKQFKVKPYCWGFSMRHSFSHKREKEDFVLSGGVVNSKNSYEQRYAELEKELDSLENIIYSKEKTLDQKDAARLSLAEVEAEMDKTNFMRDFCNPHGKNLPVSKAKGFFINISKESIMDESELSADHKKMMEHPMFLGFI